VSLLATRPIASGTIGANAETSVTGRAEIWGTTTQAIADSFPIGTGLGSFEQVYRHYEDPAKVSQEYVNHAHNEYLEIFLELGAAGLAAMAVFLAWWMLATFSIWTSSLSTPFARASTIASATILAHSIVDFPLRTAAISAIFAACIATMAQNLRSAPVIRKGEFRPTRHVTLG
jgi:O-antigen ligase